jgi:hypothetical protein
MQCNQWLKDYANDFDGRVGDFISHLEMGISSETKTRVFFEELKKYLEVIR